MNFARKKRFFRHKSPDRVVVPVVWYMAMGYPIRGGIEAHILHYASELCRYGFKTKVVVPNELPAEEHLFMRLLRQRGIPLESVSGRYRWFYVILFSILLVPWVAWQVWNRRKFSLANFWEYISFEVKPLALKCKILIERPDIVHIFGRMSHNLWKCFPADRTIFHHMTDGKMDPSWWPLEVDAFRHFAEHTARYFAPGSGVAENVHKEFGIKRDIDVIFTMAPDENGENVSRKDAKNAKRREDLRFGILCRMTDEKGIKYILEALRLYRDKYGDVYFVFIGNGYLEDEIRLFISENKLTHVRQVKEFNNPVEVLRDVDVFVHPSVTDAMPMAIVEALMCGKPCIGAKVGGIADLIREGVEGFIVESHNAEQIFDRMERFASMTDEEFCRYKRNARARYEQMCRPDSVGRVISEHYQSIIAGAE